MIAGFDDNPFAWAFVIESCILFTYWFASRKR
jgi:hypothetical protein